MKKDTVAIEHTVRFLCGECEFEAEKGRELIDHIVVSHGYTEDQVRSAKGGLVLALDGADYHNVSEYSLDGKKLITKIARGPRDSQFG